MSDSFGFGQEVIFKTPQFGNGTCCFRFSNLLKCQETQMSYSGRESAMSDMSNARIGERQLSLDELKVTVL
ncbi:hypothetical protein CEXT_267611 [Caerostris extrusa]|uniref:Uncharacterized protein n=1 Tax=Caerostris extrusa TaxID=172846 RepID=A0AAV4UKX4_CAEEX|nr:hypothetical protein CEXT_267611 [Caerostris extrusa]